MIITGFFFEFSSILLFHWIILNRAIFASKWEKFLMKLTLIFFVLISLKDWFLRFGSHCAMLYCADAKIRQIYKNYAKKYMLCNILYKEMKRKDVNY